MNNKVVLYRWRCKKCKGGLEVMNVAVDFQQCLVSVLAECIQCGEPQAFTMDFTDFVDISRDFWLSFYKILKKLPPAREDKDEKE